MKKLLFLFCTWSLHLAAVQSQTDTAPSLDDYLRWHNLPVKSTEEGLCYAIHAPGTGAAPREGEYVLIRFRAMLLDSTVFDQSHEGEPFIFQVGNREVVKGLDKGVRLLRKGGSATLYLPPDLGYMHYGVSKTVPPESPLIFEVELADIMDFEEYDAFMRQLEERERRAFERRAEEQFEKDLRVIEQCAADRKLKARRTSSGASYAVTKPGKGENAKPGDRLELAYEGFLADGTPVESSAEGETYEFTLGAGEVLDGWEHALPFFNQGSEGWLLLPSKLAYGPLAIDEGKVRVPANSVLIFKIKVVELDRQP